jgi:ribosomal protein L32
MPHEKKTSPQPKVKTPKRIGSSIKKDVIQASDYLKYNLPMSCEECSHFKSSHETCTLGLPTEHHLKRNQEKSYLLSGKIALCRFQEID